MGSEFATSLFNGIIIIAGGIFTLLFSFTGILCAINALIKISIENRLFFQRICRLVGVIICVFGFLLPFRHVSFFGTILCWWWCSLLFQAVKEFQFYQGIAAIIVTLIFWINVTTHEKSLIQNVADSVIFVVLPSVFMLVILSRRGNLLGDQSGTANRQPVIPLESWFSKLGVFVRKVIPPTN